MENLIRYLLITGILVIFISFLNAQEKQNTELLSNLDFGESSSDIWGYVDGRGTEYALIGTRKKTRIISLENPSEPVEVISIEGTSSLWRDLKTWNDYLYVVADQGRDGLLIADLSLLPDSVSYVFWAPEVVLENSIEMLRTCHNLYVDQNGYAYLAGCNIGRGGVMILDLTENPMDPQLVGLEDQQYAHDVFVQNDRMFCSEIYPGQAAIYDISDKTAPVLLATQETGHRFTHNIWVSDKGNTMFTTDERGGAFVESYDISDLNNIRFLDSYQPQGAPQKGIIPHNTHFNNGFLYTSWYTEGVIVLDANVPDNLIKVAQFDTWPGNPGGFNGNWGAYPFLPSGLLLLSDINTGLYVLEPELPRASYLTGSVLDSKTKLPINGVNIEILDDYARIVSTDASGHYKTGIPSSGYVDVHYSHYDYYSKTVKIFLQEGNLLNLDLELDKRKKFNISGLVREENELISIGKFQVYIIGTDQEILLDEEADGKFDVQIYEGKYNMYVGGWGYNMKFIKDIDLSDDKEISILLEPGYEDNFVLDYGWEVTGNADQGIWVRDVPKGTVFDEMYANPDQDIDTDLGWSCYITGNGKSNANADDVDDGFTSLTSPLMDLTNYKNPVLRYSRRFFDKGETEGNDSLVVSITNLLDTVTLEVVRDSAHHIVVWEDTSFVLRNYIQINHSMQLIITTADDILDHIVEAAFDGFSVVEQDRITSIKNPVNEKNEILVYPNPFYDRISFELSGPNANESWIINLYNIQGERVFQYSTDKSDQLEFHISPDLPSGIYLAELMTNNNQIRYLRKMIKQ